MTPASWSPPPPRIVPAVRRALTFGIVAWHAGCIILGNTGCFVTWDVPYAAEENEPPIIDGAGLADGEVLLMDGDEPFFATAFDPDSEVPLLFSWSAGTQHLFDEPFANERDSGPDEYGSIVTVPYDPSLNGRSLNCTVIDGEGATDTWSWPVEVL